MSEEKESDLFEFEKIQTFRFDNSQILQKVVYDRVLCKLTVYFTTGTVYNYYGVNQMDVDDLCKAESVGRHFNVYFKRGQFKTEKVE